MSQEISHIQVFFQFLLILTNLEFLMAAMDNAILFSKGKIEAAFKMFD